MYMLLLSSIFVIFVCISILLIEEIWPNQFERYETEKTEIVSYISPSTGALYNRKGVFKPIKFTTELDDSKIIYPPPKTKMASWKITIFNKKDIFKWLAF